MKNRKRPIAIAVVIAVTLFAAIATYNLVQACGDSACQLRKPVLRIEKKDDAGSDEKTPGMENKREDAEEQQRRVRVNGEDPEKFGIRSETVGPGKIDVYLTFPAETALNSDRTAQIVPRLAGIVSEVHKNIGDVVTAGEVMAVIESRELAEAKAKYLAALSRMDLAQTNFTRFESLWQKEVVPEKQFLEMKNALEEAQIEVRSARQKLLAMGLPPQHVKDLPSHPDESLTRYEILAPFDGVVISKRITLGEMRKEDHEAFVISDLSSVWVNLNVSQKDLPHVKEGQSVVISTGNGIPDSKGRVAYLEPVVGDKTRCAIARVVLLNLNKKWRPGLFVTAKVMVDSKEAPLVVPKDAIQSIEGKSVVFVQGDKKYEPRIVKIGQSNGSHVEIVSGLKSGDQYAAKQTFLLKSELGKPEDDLDH